MSDIVHIVVYGYKFNPNKFEHSDVQDYDWRASVDEDKNVIFYREPWDHSYAIVGVPVVVECGMIDFTEYPDPEEDDLKDMVYIIDSLDWLDLSDLSDGPNWYAFTHRI